MQPSAQTARSPRRRHATIVDVAQPRVSIVAGELTRELRRTVLRPHQAVAHPLPGDDVADAVHFAILDGDGGTPLCACFVLVESYPWPRATSQPAGSPPQDRTQWHLRSVATDPAHQRTGLGTVLLQAVLHFVSRNDGGILWCNARTPAVPFYERLGLTTYGTEHISHGLAHLYMWCAVDPRADPSVRSAAGVPAVDGQTHTTDHGGGVAEQKDDRPGDLVFGGPSA